MSIAPERVTVSQSGNGLVAKLNSPPPCEPAITEEISEQLQSALEDCPDDVQSMRLDMGLVPSIASDGLNRLIGFHTKASDQGINVELTDVQPAVRELFEITRLDRMFHLREDESAP